VIPEFETGNRPQFDFDTETGVLYLTQEHYAERVSGISITPAGIVRGRVDIRNTGNVRHRNRQVIVDGRPVQGVDLNAIDGITFVDTGIVVIYVPEDFTIEAISIETGSASMRVFGENSLTIQSVYATTGNGSVALTDVFLQDISLAASNGSLALTGAVVDGNTSMRTTNGSIAVSDSQILSPFSIRTTNGSIALYNSSFAENLSAEVTNGSIGWHTVTAKQNASAVSTNGTIALSNSRIEGRLFSRVSNGTVMLSNIDTNMDNADIASGRHGRVFIDGALQR